MAIQRQGFGFQSASRSGACQPKGGLNLLVGQQVGDGIAEGSPSAKVEDGGVSGNAHNEAHMPSFQAVGPSNLVAVVEHIQVKRAQASAFFLGVLAGSRLVQVEVVG